MDKTEIETKAAGHEVGEAFEEFMRAFEASSRTTSGSPRSSGAARPTW